jgi:uncharacterized membrane protein
MNSGGAKDGAEAVLFATRLRPHRALSRLGRIKILGFFAAIQGAIGLALCFHGAWPAACFLALTWTGLALAFIRNAHAAKAYEEIELTALELHYARVSPVGLRRDWRFHPLWVRLGVERHEEFGVERIDLLIRRRRLEIGVFLGRSEKTQLAARLSAALALARQGPHFPGPCFQAPLLAPEMKKDRL